MDSKIEATKEHNAQREDLRGDDRELDEGRVEESFVEYLAFMLAGEEYGIEISGVREVIRWMDILEVPRIPNYIRGIISLRGSIIPVFDLKRRLGLKETQRTQQTRVIVTSHGKAVYGLLVDSVFGVVPVFPSRVETPPGGMWAGTDFLKGVMNYEKGGQSRLLILLKLERIITP